MADHHSTALSPQVLVAERERVIARLSDAFAHDRLDMEEFERRLTLAHEQNSIESLRELLADLAEKRADSQTSTAALAHASSYPEYQEIVALFAAASFRGQGRCLDGSKSRRYSAACSLICARPSFPTA
jgi:uncharacterized coiled-coil protein SlyX